MNDLLAAMSSDMNIERYNGETEESFTYRLCYSALGAWCLNIAQNSSEGLIGSTKVNHTIMLSELLERFSEVFPAISGRFIDENNQQNKFPLHIRTVYEETGYLLTDENNRNRIANFGRSISYGESALFFGVPNTKYTVNGLGIFTPPTSYRVSPKEFMIRDDLSWEEYFQVRADPLDFNERDISAESLEFFNPKLDYAPSNSWGKKMETDFSVARKSKMGPYYRVLRGADGGIQFADANEISEQESFMSYEFRRLTLAMKAHYGKPLKATISKQDDEYSRIRLGGHLPNREYHYLLLISWPENNAFDKINFIIKNSLLEAVTITLANIGIEIKGGPKNV